LLLDTCDRAVHLESECCLYLADCSPEEARDFALIHSLTDIQVGIQQGSGLGERMWNAFTDVWRQGDRVVFLGSDSPSLPLSYIRLAFEALLDVSVVLGPVKDGGYFLIGLSSPHPELFRNISWGSSKVFQETLDRLSDTPCKILPEWYDIDLPEDLSRLSIELKSEFDGFPERTRSFIEDWGIPGS